MPTQKNLITLCFATVFTLGLAACGGGGGGDAPVTGMTDMDGGDTDDTMTSSLVGKVIPAGTMVMLPAGLVDGVTATFDAMEGDTVDVPGVGSFKCVAGPCAVDIANNEVTTTGDIEVVSLADLPAEVLMALASAIAPAGPTAEEIATAATEAAATKVTAITAEADQTTDAGLGGTGVDTVTMTVSRDRDGTTVEIEDTANAEDDDPKFALAMDLGNGRTMHTRTMEADADGNVVEEVVIVSTDIAAPTAVAFAKWQTMNGDTPQVLDVMKDDGQTPDDGETANALDIDNNTPALVARMMPVRSISDAMLNYTQDNPGAEPTMDVDEGLHDGTYNGAEGTFRCTRDAVCTITFDDKGKVSGASDGWVFIPDSGATSDEPDYNYLHYGFWLQKTTAEDGVLTYNEVETFADSSIDASGSVAEVEGSATYEGGAVGVYVRNVYLPSTTGEKELDSATSGHFKADASLMVYFSGNDVALNKQNTVTGTIDNFALAGGEANEWSVALKGGITEGTGVIADGGTANGGGAEGSFSGTFHGSTAEYDHDMDTDTPMINRQPSSVVGEFNANFSNGSVAGGFGARKQ